MASLKSMQSYAEKCAIKLGITDTIVLRWSGKICKCGKNTNAHCHIANSEFPRGTICINKANLPLYRPTYYIHRLIAHEVSHLATKATHNTPTFARRMVSLGKANKHEKRLAKSMRGHKHIYSFMKNIDGLQHFYCHYCKKEKPQ